MTRTSFRGLVTACGLIIAGVSSAAPQPNILLILVDDLGYNDLGCYAYPGDLASAGQSAPSPYPEKAAFAAPNQAIAMVDGKRVSLTPHLDRLAAQGVKFTDYHAPATVCSPSRLGLMTGRMPARFGLGGIISEKKKDPAGLPSREITLAEALKGSGYATAAFGKWHLGNDKIHEPTNHGFDHYWPATGERATELERLTQQVIAFIQENRNGPFFAYFAPHQPHHPNVPHPDFAGSSTKLLGPRSYMKGNESDKTQTSSKSDFHDVVHELDFRIGQLLKRIDELGLTENTIVIFTSDNGPWTGQTQAKEGKPGIIGTGYPYRGGKFEYWEGSSRVPAIIRYPKEIPAGVVTDAPASGLDWFVTLTKRGGGTIPADRKLDGFDLWPFLTKLPGTASPRPYIAHERGKNVLAVSNGRFKQFENRLVNLRTDFTEVVDVQSDNANVSTEMSRQLAEANASLAAEKLKLEPAAPQEILLAIGSGRYLDVANGSPSAFTISLSSAPSANLIVQLRQRSGTSAISVSPASLTFTKTNWKTPQTVTVTTTGTSESFSVFEVKTLDSMPIKELFIRANLNAK